MAAELTIPRVIRPAGPPDSRTINVRTIHDGCGFRPLAEARQWQLRAVSLREQVLVAAGLWPLPERCPLKAVVHGRADRGRYILEKVFFQSFPNFYVSGSLYRPAKIEGRVPGVLCPYGHWEADSNPRLFNGRFLRCDDDKVKSDLAGGFEKEASAARFPLQARCANLAMLGGIVFHYDMIGYADAQMPGFDHRGHFRQTRCDLLGLSMLGLQLWNSMRSLDFLLSLPEVDPQRIACTGASGGATQTIMLMAADPRLMVAAPVCMISAGEHQGGCACENAPLLRIATDNVELAASFAPKPLIHPSASRDWTSEFPEKGFPEIQATYALLGAPNAVTSAHFPSPHNYNLNSRQAVYNFFNTHLRLGHPTPVVEEPFQPFEPTELSVFDAAHPRPADSLDAAQMQKFWEISVARQMAALRPIDAASLEKFRAILGIALRHMTATALPSPEQVIAQFAGTTKQGNVSLEKLLIFRKGEGFQVPAVLLRGSRPSPKAAVLVHPGGKAACAGPVLDALLSAGYIVLLPDLFLTGETEQPAPKLTRADPADFISAYNRMILANRVHDLLTVIGFLRRQEGVGRVDLIGLERAGVWCALARSLAGPAIARAAVDADQFEFDQVKSVADAEYLPCALRYGGLGALASVAAPADLLVHNCPPTAAAWLHDAYRAADAEQSLRLLPDAIPAAIVDWIAR